MGLILGSTKIGIDAETACLLMPIALSTGSLLFWASGTVPNI